MITIPMFSELFHTKHANAKLRFAIGNLRDDNVVITHNWCVTTVEKQRLQQENEQLKEELNNAKLRIASLEADDANGDTRRIDDKDKASLTYILNF